MHRSQPLALAFQIICTAAWVIAFSTFFCEMDVGWGSSGYSFHSRTDLAIYLRYGVAEVYFHRNIADESSFIGTDAPNGWGYLFKARTPHAGDLKDFATGFEAKRHQGVWHSGHGHELLLDLRFPLWCILLPASGLVWYCARRFTYRSGRFEVTKREVTKRDTSN